MTHEGLDDDSCEDGRFPRRTTGHPGPDRGSGGTRPRSGTEGAASEAELKGFQDEFNEDEGDALTEESLNGDEPARERRLKSNGEHVQRETKIAIIGRPKDRVRPFLQS